MSNTCNLKKWSLSKFAVILIVSVVLYQDITYKYYKDENRIIGSDVLNFYAYLPATFIFHDLHLQFLWGPDVGVSKYYWPHKVENGNYIIYTTMGMSMMYAPFFIAVHYPVKWLGYNAVGYSPPYRVAIMLASLFYLTLSLFVLRKILLKHFSEFATAVSLVLLVLATNLLYYVADEPGMSHAFNFALGIFFLHFTIKWYEKPGFWNSLGIGLITGLIALIRPTDVVIVTVFIFWGLKAWKDVQERVILYFRKSYLLLIIVIASVLVWVPQMLYWKYLTGSFLYNAYADDDSKFFFTNPQILLSLFSYRKGWLLYTPVMFLIFPGFILLWKRYRELFWPVLIYFLVNLWVVSSWYIPWYGGSYSQRAYVASYSIIALSLTAAVSFLLTQKRIVMQVLGILIAAVFLFHNLFQLKQFHHGAVHYISMTREAYWDSFGRSYPSPRFNFLISYPSYDSARMGLYPTPVINPLYTGKLTKPEIFLCVRQQFLEKLEKDVPYRIAFYEQAMKKNTSFRLAVDEEATFNMKQKIEDKIILVKKN